MELFSFYQSFMTTAQMLRGQTSDGLERVIIVCAVFATLSYCALFILQAIGLSAMAKNRGIGKRWLAFVPFVNMLFLGKLAGDCEMFGHKMKHASVYAMVAQIVSTILYLLFMVAEGLLYTRYADNYTAGAGVWSGLTGFAEFLNGYYTSWGGLLCSVFGLVYELLVFLLMMSLLKKYSPSNYLFLSFLQLFVPVSRYIVVFVIRNRKQIDYNAYMRARYEEYARRNAYGNPYSNPYGNNPYNRPPYGQNPYGNPNGNPYTNNQNDGYSGQNKSNDEPFAEFGSNDDSPFEDFNGN